MKQHRMLYLMLVIVLFISFVFTGCSNAENPSYSNTKESVSSNTTVKQTQTETQPIMHSADEFVETKKEFDVPYSGSFKITGEKRGNYVMSRNRIPQLTIDSEDAKKINDDIISKYWDVFENIYSNCYEKNMNSDFRIDYQCYLNNNVISLVVEQSTTMTANNSFNVYNIDINTKEELDYETVIKLSNVSVDNAREQVKEAIRNEFSEAAVPDENMINETREKSLSDENIDKAMFYFDDDGNLIAAYSYYWFAGAETYENLLSLDAKIKDNDIRLK